LNDFSMISSDDRMIAPAFSPVTSCSNPAC
jgi:hypothetical protein